MTEETLNKANELKAEIERLNKEVLELPRYIINHRQYEESNHKYMYIPRRLVRERYKLVAFKGHFSKDYEMELTEEDLKALVKIRIDKISELKTELAELN